jgi:CubicO group peptidase (beta-lactamase class C family)
MRQIIESGIAAGAFPGAVIHFSHAGKALWHEAVGQLGYLAPYDVPTTTETFYDLASVTKIYTLATALLALREAGVPLETPLQHFFVGFEPRITLELLMAHASGIEFAIQRLENVAAEEWIDKIIEAPLATKPGSSVLYSCTNLFLLARVVERVVGSSLDAYFEARIKEPLQLKQTSFEPLPENTAPTEQTGAEFWRGIVHDEAARSWRRQTGHCAGNAGLFATPSDVARFAAIWTQGGPQLLHPDDVRRAFATRFPERTYWRGLGFQIDAAFYMSEKAPSGTEGHLGFTGPSLVIHSETNRIAVILNNRVHPTRNGPDRLPWHRQMAARFFVATAVPTGEVLKDEVST